LTEKEPLARQEIAESCADALDFMDIGAIYYTFSGEILYLNATLWRILELEPFFESPRHLVGCDIQNTVRYVRPTGEIRGLIREQGAIRNHEYPVQTLSGRFKWLIGDGRIGGRLDTGEEYIQLFVRENTAERRSMELLRIQRDIASELGASETLEQALDTLADLLVRRTDFDLVCALVPDDEGGLRTLVSREISRSFLAELDLVNYRSPEMDILRRGVPRLLSQADLERPHYVSYIREGITSAMFLPVIHNGRPVALLLLGSRHHPEISPDARAMAEGTLTLLAALLDRVQARDEIREREKRYRRLTESVTDYIFTVRVVDGHPAQTIHSPLCEKVTGYTPEDFLRDPWLWINMVHPDDRDMVRRQVDAILREGHAEPIEHRIYRKDGAERWVRNTPVCHYDLDGRLVAYDGLIQDITERKMAEQALLESEQRFRTLVENAADAFFLTDYDGRILDVNQQACRSLGYTREELLSLNVADIDPLFNIEQYREVMRSLRKQGSVVTLEGHQKRKDGSFLPVEFRFSFARLGESEYMLAQVRDITERLRAEAERRELELQFQEAHKLESLGLMAGGIAHDFNNLLTVILGNADLLLQELPQDSPLRNRLGEIEKGARTAADLCAQLLAYAGKSPMNFQVLQLNHLVRDITGLMELSIRRRAALALELAPSLPPMRGDSARLRQVILNLLTNAAEAINHRDGRITLRTSTREIEEAELSKWRMASEAHAGRFIILEVTDNGCGMDEATLAKIFDPFFTTKFTGRGLGLGAVLGIMRAHQGLIDVWSRPGSGTRFILAFPVAEGVEVPQDENETEPADHDKPARDLDSMTRGTVLVVDDEEGPRLICERMLARHGFSVVTAENGLEGLERFREDPGKYTLAILDYTMPGMNGEELLREMRAVRPDLPAIFFSGYSDRFITGLPDFDPPALFLQKPFRAAQLVDKVLEVLRITNHNDSQA